MPNLIHNANGISQWVELIVEAQSLSATCLCPDLESYLVFLLMRFTNKPQISNTLIAENFLQGALATGRTQQQFLHQVGDHCLLFSGLFPKLAERRRVHANYFIEIGQSAFYSLTGLPQHQWQGPYKALCEDFLTLTAILKNIRRVSAAANLDLFLEKSYQKQVDILAKPLEKFNQSGKIHLTTVFKDEIKNQRFH